MPTLHDQDEVRESFWNAHPDVANLRRSDGRDPRDVRQNSQPCDTRAAFVDYVDQLARSGDISDELAQSVTL